MFTAINLKKLFKNILFVECAGVLSALITRGAAREYAAFVKPNFAPPAYAYAVVWAILFAFMGIALYTLGASSAKPETKKTAYIFFYIHLAFNFFLNIIFYNLNMHGFAIIWLIALILLAAVNIRQFYTISKGAGILLVPYILWSLFALYLYYGIWILNKAA